MLLNTHSTRHANLLELKPVPLISLADPCIGWSQVQAFPSTRHFLHQAIPLVPGHLLCLLCDGFQRDGRLCGHACARERRRQQPFVRGPAALRVSMRAWAGSSPSISFCRCGGRLDWPSQPGTKRSLPFMVKCCSPTTGESRPELNCSKPHTCHTRL